MPRANRTPRSASTHTHTAAKSPADVVDVPQVGPALERVLLALCRWDGRMLAHRDLPFGSSVFLAAVKPA